MFLPAKPQTLSEKIFRIIFICSVSINLTVACIIERTIKENAYLQFLSTLHLKTNKELQISVT